MHGDSANDATKLLVPVLPDLTRVRLSTRSLSSTPHYNSTGFYLGNEDLVQMP